MTEYSDLTDKRQVFVEEYLKCWNGAEAARRAGYAYPRQEASRLLSNDDIKGIVQARIQEKAMDADEVLAHLADMARFDIGDLMGKAGVVNWDDAKEQGLTRFVKKIKWKEGELEIETYDRMAALELLGKNLEMWVERQKQEQSGAIEIRFLGNVGPNDV